MSQNSYKRVAYLAPELPSLSATFVTNEIWALERLGVEVHPYSIHAPQNKAHGEDAEALAKRTEIIYHKSIGQNFRAFFWNSFHHKRSTVKALFILFSDLIRTGLISKNSFKLVYQFIRSPWMAVDMRQKSIEHLHIHFAHVPTQVAMYACALSGIPFTFQTHANDIFERPLLVKQKVKRAKKAISISNFNIDLMIQKGAKRDNIKIVRCGVDSNLPILKDINKPLDPPIVGTLGRLVEKKGVDTLIKAASILKAKNVNFRIEIAGDGPLLNSLKELVKSEGIDEKVRFIGSLPHSEALKWISGLDIFVLAGKKDRNGDMDGIPVVLMEAMNFGVPVISTKISGIPELVIDMKTGLSGEPGKESDLADNISKILNDKDLAIKLAENAKNIIINEFDINLNAKRLLDIIQS